MKIGVFICHCGSNIAGTVDCAKVAEIAKTYPDVAFSTDTMYTCSEPGQEEIVAAIKEHKLDGVVVASCTPRMHEPTFRRTVERAGLNRYMFEMANIREHVSWIGKDKEANTNKAAELVRIAVEKLRRDNPLFSKSFESTKRVLVIGGGDTGNDCQGTALRQGCTDLMALEMMPQPPKERAANNPWPEWPRVLKVDYGQTECLAKFGKDPRVYQTTVKEFLKDDAGNLTGAIISYLKPERNPETGRTSMVPTGEEFTYNCQLAFIAAGFTGCESYVADAFGVELTARGNVADHSFKTNVEKVFVCGDMRRGQSLVVWGLREGRDCAAEVDRYLMGYTNL